MAAIASCEWLVETRRVALAAMWDRSLQTLFNMLQRNKVAYLADEDALVAALAARRIAGAGLDVFAHEPHVPQALLAMDHVVLQPHQGSATVHTRQAMADLVLANLDAWFAGAPLLTPVV